MSSERRRPGPKPGQRHPGQWQPGQSGNPAGRPRTGLAFAERVRDRIDPDAVLDLALEVIADTKLSAATRLAAILPIVDRGFMKPPTTTDVTVSQPREGRDWSAIPLAERQALLAQLRAVRDGTAGVEPATSAESSSSAAAMDVACHALGTGAAS